MSFKYTPEHDLNGGDWIKSPGTYDLKIVAVENKLSNGNDMAVVTMACVESGEQVQDRLFQHNASVQKRLVWFLRAIGYPMDHGTDISVESCVNENCIGKTLKADIIIGETSNGNPRAEVEFSGYYKYAKEESKPVEPKPETKETKW